MKSMSIVAFGHSHMSRMQKVIEEHGLRFGGQLDIRFVQMWGRYDPFTYRKDQKLAYNENLVADVINLARDTGASAFIGSLIGAEHFAMAIEGQSRPFDVILPSDPDIPSNPGAENIPHALLYARMFQHISDILSFCGWLQKSTGLPVYMVLPPPPVAKLELFLWTIPEELKTKIEQFGIPHWSIRYKLWRIWIEAATQIANTDGVQIVSAPDGVTDANGLLRQEYAADCVHGNENYCWLLWQKLIAEINAGV